MAQEPALVQTHILKLLGALKKARVFMDALPFVRKFVLQQPNCQFVTLG